MTDGNIELSRRTILAGLGAVGAAGAGAGLGTSAFFTDEESFEGNTVTAGTLDLKVDWEEHYSYPQIYGHDDPADGIDVTRSEPNDTDGYVALPDPDSPSVWVADDDLDAYMDNTSIEAFPDVDDDGVQDDFNSGEVEDVCTDGADTPSDLDPTAGLRTQNEDTYDSDADEPTPLVDLSDVKPGDFGELTLSFHLCSNPGYVWLAGEFDEARENGHTEPEASASGEDGPSDEVVTDLGNGDDVELLDAVETAIWYDGDCDNVFEPGGDPGSDDEPADVVLVLDRSGSMRGSKLANAKAGAKSLVDALGPNDQVSLISFSSHSSLDAGLTPDHNSVKSAIDGMSAGGGTNMEAGVEHAREELGDGTTFNGSPYSESGNARSNVKKFVIVLSDGQPNGSTKITDPYHNEDPREEASDAKSDGVELSTIAYGNPSGSAKSTLQDMASDPQGDHYFEADVSEIEGVFQSLGGTVGTAGEEVIFRGTLRETLQELTSGNGIPLDGDLSTDDRSCYPALQTSCVGLAWRVPDDVGNGIQSDSVAFDLGFYAEQCRNNDGTA